MTRIDNLNTIACIEPCSGIDELLGKAEIWEQALTKYELDHTVQLDMDLKLGALMKMLP